jgi:hypothetical protein
VPQTWYFARDDRVHKALLVNLDQQANFINRSIGRRLRWQFRVIRAVMEGNSRTYRVRRLRSSNAHCYNRV